MDYDQQIQAAQLRQRDAMGRTQFQNPQGRMVSGIYVAPNPLEYLSAALRSAGAGREAMMAGQEVEQASAAKKQAVAEALRNFGTMAQSRPADAPLPEDVPGPVRPAQAPDLRGAYAALMQAPDAGLQQAGVRGMMEMPQMEAQAAQRAQDMEFKKAEAEAARQARTDQLNLAHQQRMEALQMQNASREQMAQAQREFQAQMQQERLQSQREMRQLTGAVASAAGGPMGNPPAGYRFTPDGNLEPIPGGPAADKGGQKPLTESQAKGSLYLGQMRSATAELDKMPSISPASVAAAGTTWTNWAAPKEAQQVAQLQNQWAEAYLRAKTGAATTEEEVALNRRTFFPVVGDSKAVIEQKARMRKQAERDMVPVAGPGAASAGGGMTTQEPGMQGRMPFFSTPSPTTEMPTGFKVIR